MNALNGLDVSAGLLDELVTALPAPAFVKDAERRFVACNQAFADYAARERLELIGLTDSDMPWARYDQTTNRAGYRRWDHQVLSAGAPVIGVHESILTAAGEIRQIKTSKLPLRANDGAIVGVFGSFVDAEGPLDADTGAMEAARRAVNEEIVLRYLGGASVSQLAARTNTTQAQIYKILHAQDFVGDWRSVPRSWERYPVFLSALRECRLDLIREEITLSDSLSAVSDETLSDLAIVRTQLALLYEALAGENLEKTHSIVRAHLENRANELRSLTVAEPHAPRPADRPAAPARYKHTVRQRFYRRQLRKIETVLRQIDQELSPRHR